MGVIEYAELCFSNLKYVSINEAFIIFFTSCISIVYSTTAFYHVDFSTITNILIHTYYKYIKPDK